MHPKLDYSELTNTVYIVFGNNHHKKIDVTEQFNRLRTILIPLKQEPDNSTSNDIRSETRSGFTICPHSGLVCYDPECGVTTNICNNSHCFREPGNEAKKDGRLKIYLVQTKQLLIVGCFSTEEKAKKYAGNGDVMIQEVEVF